MVRFRLKLGKTYLKVLRTIAHWSVDSMQRRCCLSARGMLKTVFQSLCLPGWRVFHIAVETTLRLMAGAEPVC